jgi:hypothetical protein
VLEQLLAAACAQMASHCGGAASAETLRAAVVASKLNYWKFSRVRTGLVSEKPPAKPAGQDWCGVRCVL